MRKCFFYTRLNYSNVQPAFGHMLYRGHGPRGIEMLAAKLVCKGGK